MKNKIKSVSLKSRNNNLQYFINDDLEYDCLLKLFQNSQAGHKRQNNAVIPHPTAPVRTLTNRAEWQWFEFRGGWGRIPTVIDYFCLSFDIRPNFGSFACRSFGRETSNHVARMGSLHT